VRLSKRRRPSIRKRQRPDTHRKSAAVKLAKLAESQINTLAMKVKFEVNVHPAGASGRTRVKGTGFSPYIDATKSDPALAPEDRPLDHHRLDTVECRISTNPASRSSPWPKSPPAEKCPASC